MPAHHGCQRQAATKAARARRAPAAPARRSWLQGALGGGYARAHAAQAAAAAAKGANETQAMPMSLKILAGGMAGARGGWVGEGRPDSRGRRRARLRGRRAAAAPNHTS
jgi:hypothetical protein